MGDFILKFLNRIARGLPRQVLRMIADCPGILWITEHLAANRSLEVESPEGYKLLLNPLFHASLSARSLYDYEPDLRRAINKLTKPEMVAYDIGANVGIFTLLFARIVGPRGVVYAFEPEPNNWQYLKRSVSLNQLDHVLVNTRAIGDCTGTAVFDRRGGAFSGRLLGTDPKYRRSMNLLNIPTAAIDDLIKREGLKPPDIVKIDVEGNELMVLKGMAYTLATHRPVILCETHTHLGESAQGVISLLTAFGYSVFSLHDVAERPTTAWSPLTELPHAMPIVGIRKAQAFNVPT